MQYAFNWLWGRSITIFRVENMEATAEATASEGAGARASNRAVGGYMAGCPLVISLLSQVPPAAAGTLCRQQQVQSVCGINVS